MLFRSGIVSENDRSERTIVGGEECVSPDAFSNEIVYTALGHLHRGQQVCGREEVRYAGAPLPMSFAEKNYKQSVALVEIEGAAVTKIEKLLYDAPVKVLSIPNEARPLEEVLEEIDKLPEGEITETSPYLEVKVLITEPEPSLRNRIEEALKTNQYDWQDWVLYKLAEMQNRRLLPTRNCRQLLQWRLHGWSLRNNLGAKRCPTR